MRLGSAEETKRGATARRIMRHAAASSPGSDSSGSNLAMTTVTEAKARSFLPRPAPARVAPSSSSFRPPVKEGCGAPGRRRSKTNKMTPPRRPARLFRPRSSSSPLGRCAQHLRPSLRRTTSRGPVLVPVGRSFGATRVTPVRTTGMPQAPPALPMTFRSTRTLGEERHGEDTRGFCAGDKFFLEEEMLGPLLSPSWGEVG